MIGALPGFAGCAPRLPHAPAHARIHPSSDGSSVPRSGPRRVDTRQPPPTLPCAPHGSCCRGGDGAGEDGCDIESRRKCPENGSRIRCDFQARGAEGLRRRARRMAQQQARLDECRDRLRQPASGVTGRPPRSPTRSSTVAHRRNRRSARSAPRARAELVDARRATEAGTRPVRRAAHRGHDVARAFPDRIERQLAGQTRSGPRRRNRLPPRHLHGFGSEHGGRACTASTSATGVSNAAAPPLDRIRLVPSNGTRKAQRECGGRLAPRARDRRAHCRISGCATRVGRTRGGHGVVNRPRTHRCA